MESFRANGALLRARERRHELPLSDRTDSAGTWIDSEVPRSTVMQSTLMLSPIFLAPCQSGKIVENDEKLCSHCHMSLLILGQFYRCLVVCITTSSMWTDKRKEKFSIWENTLCKYCSLVFIYIKSQGAGFRVSLLPPTRHRTTLNKENSPQCKSSIHLSLASDVNWTVVYDGLESERYEIFVGWDVLCQLDLSNPQSRIMNSRGGDSWGIQIFHVHVACQNVCQCAFG